MAVRSSASAAGREMMGEARKASRGVGGAVVGRGAGVRRRMECFECRGNHPARFCKERTLTCWRCGEPGHLARDCGAGNGAGKPLAPAVFQGL